jgi:hypothetical protein
MIDSDELERLETRRAVRDFLARAVDDLSGGTARPQLPADLADLATGSDREVIASCRLLDKCYDVRGSADARSADAAIGRQIRELFSRALERMKQLPPDPREAVTTPVAAGGAPVSHVRRKQI